MKHRLQTLLKHKLQWLVLLTALLGVSQGVWGWSIAGSFNSWNKCAYVSVGGYIDFSLAANTSYTFKIWNGNCSSGEDGTWYGNNGTISASTGDSGWQFYTTSGNCTLKTSSAGTYRIKLVSSAPSVQVIFPASCTTPTVSNFTVGTSEYTYDGSSKSVSVTAKYGSPTITVYYTGINGTSYTKSTTAPSAVGRYKVTVNATAVSSYCAVSDLEVATLKIKKTVTVRVKKEGDYASTTPYLYSWYGTDETKGSGEWAGTAMTLDGTSYKHQITIDASTYNIIISKSSSGTDQTGDITGLTGDVCYSVSSKTATAATATKPTVTSASASSITTTTATLGGNVTDAGQTAACATQTVTARGIEWVSGTGKTAGAKEAAAAGGTGSFTVAVTGLSAGTTYTYRAYATNAAGTSYGPNVSFTTSSSCSTPSASDITISAPSSATTLYLGTGSEPSITQTVTATCSKGNTYLWTATPSGYSYTSAFSPGSGTMTNVSFTSSSSKSTTATFKHEGVYTATFKAGCSNTTDASKNASTITVKPGHIYFDGPFFSGSGYDLTKQHVEINTSTDQFVYEWTAAYTSGDFVISVGNACNSFATSAYTIGNYAEITTTGVTKASSGNHNFSPNIGTINVGERLKLTVAYTGVNSSGVPKYSVTLEKVCSNPTVQTVSGTATICSGSSTNVTVASSQSNYTYKLYKGGSATATTKAGTGSALNFSVSAAGTYTVHAYYTSGSDAYCKADMSGSATVSVNATSAVGSISGAGAVCSGSGKTLTLGSKTGNVTKWEKSTTSASTGYSDVANTTTTLSTGNLTQQTWYRVVVKSGVCDAVTSDPVTVPVTTVPTQPTFTSGDATVCSGVTGKTYTVSGTSGATYQWTATPGTGWTRTDSGTGTSATYTIGTANGTITATPQYTANGITCTGTAQSMSVTVDAASVAGSVSGSSQQVCLGVKRTLTVKDYKGSIQWHTSTVSGFEPGPSTQIDGATSEKYYAPINAVGTKYYKAVITNGVCNAATTAQAYVTVNRDYEYTDFTLSDNAQTYNGSARAVTVSEKSGAGNGAITIYYTGTGTTTYATSTTAPTNAGTYSITIDVAKSTTSPYYCANNDLGVGTLTISKADQPTAVTIDNETSSYCVSTLGTDISLEASGGNGTGLYSFEITGGTVAADKRSISGSTLTVSAAGTVTITATRAADNNYNAKVSNPVTFTFTANGPKVFTLTNEGASALCGKGDGSSTGTGGSLRLTGSETGYTYQLKNGDSDYGDPVSGTGSALTFPVSSSGVYTCIAYYGSDPTQCPTPMDVEDGGIIMVVNITPRLIPGTPTVRQYQAVTVTSTNTEIDTWVLSGEGADAYTYDRTPSSITLKANTTGSPYRLIATTSAGCTATAVITVIADTENCPAP